MINIKVSEERRFQMKQIEAKEVIKTLNWIAQSDDSSESIFEPKLNCDGIYECRISLRFIKKTVIGLGDSKLDAIDNATKQTSKIIDEYIKENPKFKLKDIFGNAEYILEEDDNGYLCIHLIQKGEYH